MRCQGSQYRQAECDCNAPSVYQQADDKEKDHKGKRTGYHSAQ